jgi:hypothetical protein
MSPRDTRVPLVSGSALLPVRRRPAILPLVLALSALGVGGLSLEQQSGCGHGVAGGA